MCWRPDSIRVASGQAGLFCDKTGVTFDDFKVHLGYSHDPLTPRTSGLPQTSLTSGKLEVQGDLGGPLKRGGETVVENFADDRAPGKACTR